MKHILAILLSFSFAFCLDIENFQADIYTKSNALRKVEISLELVLKTENIKKSPIYDVLNVIIGSFYAEDLMTSMGKENLKQALMKYASQKYNIEIEEIYILSLKFVDDTNIEKIIKAIKTRDLCANGSKRIEKPETKNEFDNLNDFGKDFGDN